VQLGCAEETGEGTRGAKTSCCQIKQKLSQGTAGLVYLNMETHRHTLVKRNTVLRMTSQYSGSERSTLYVYAFQTGTFAVEV